MTSFLLYVSDHFKTIPPFVLLQKIVWQVVFPVAKKTACYCRYPFLKNCGMDPHTTLEMSTIDPPMENLNNSTLNIHISEVKSTTLRII